MKDKSVISVSAPGKVHFLGEHVIVYGKPAIISALDKRCYVTITPNNFNKVNVSSRQLNKSLEIDKEQILAVQLDAQNKWQQYIKSTDVATLRSIIKNELDFAVIAIGETLKFFNKKIPMGFSLEIDSEIPMGAGLGSSAAISVSIAAAVALFLDESLDKEKINEISFLTEQKRHGIPSGGDNSTVCYGGLVWFRKESPELKIIKPVPFSLPQNLATKFILLDTGKPKETTGEMVLIVKNLVGKRPKWSERIFNDQEKQVKKVLLAIKENNEKLLMEAIKLGERNLEKLGVVSKFSHDLIRNIEETNGVAKICGGGGKSDKTGVVLAYHSNLNKVIDLAKSRNLRYFQAKLGVEGVRVESVKSLKSK